ncbi:MAG TPA: chromosome partitioning protein ParA, partial [Roseiflexaceae bacterium]|nr:chromosome partitioning protein ParA [Roseiflexaceae bacterium]
MAQLQEWQTSAEQLFVEAQSAFDATDEQVQGLKQPDQAAFQTATENYTRIAASVAKAEQLLQQTEARRGELDALGAQAPAKVDDAKKALADAAQRLDVLGENVQRDAILRPVEEQVGRAEALLEQHQAAAAIPVAEAASAAATALLAVLARFGDLQEGLSAGRAAAERATTQGFRVEGGLAAFDQAEQELTRATRALEQGGVAAATPILDSAEAARAEGVGRGGSLPALFEQNNQRIPELRAELEQVAAYIAEGRRTFDKVDEFAPSTWNDIRGNGSEAEAAHAAAATLIDQAAAGNTMETQEIYEAKQDLDAAAERLAFARQLIDAIVQRLRDLEAARSAARDEIAAAQADIQTGQSYVQQHDPDIGQAPESGLQRAAELLAQASAEINRQQPNWLQVVKQAQEANKLADEALAGARSEVERIAKLREELKRARPVAMGEVQKIAEFVKIHDADIPPASKTRLSALANDVQLAENAAVQAEQREDQARAAQLRDAIDQYTALHDKAEQLYAEIYAEFQKADQLRNQLHSHVVEAQNAMMRADALRRQLGAAVASHGDGLLAQAQSTLNAIGTVRTERELQAAIEAADRAREYARQAEQAYTNDINTIRRSQSSSGDLLTGMVIGQILGGGRRGGGWGGGRHGGGWGSGGGWGGSSGGGAWGGGGSSGGGS